MLLDTEVTRGLPVIVGIGEEDGLGTDGLGNTLNGSLLLSGTGDSGTVGGTAVGPTSLQVQDVLATELLEDLVLGQSELTGLLGGGVSVEEGVDVGTDDVDGAAESGLSVLLPDVDRLSGGDLSGVTGSLEGRLAGGDEGSQLGSGDVAGGDSLVTDDNQLDHVPLSPLGDGLNLLLSTGGTGALDEDTDDQVETEVLGGGTDVLQGVAVSGVDTDQVETLLLDDLQVLGDLGLGHAVTGGGVGGEGHTVLTLAGDTGAGATSAGRLSGAGAGGSNNNGAGGRGSSGGGDGGSRDRAGARGSGQSGGLAVSVGAVEGGVGASDGHNAGGLGVGTGGEGLGGRVDDHSAGGHGGDGTRDNGVGTSSGASVGGVLNGAGGGGAVGLDSGVGAGDGGLSVDNGGDTTNGVSTAGNSSGSSTADGSGVSDGQSSGRDSVDTGGGEAGDTGSGQGHNDGGGLRSGSRSRGSLDGGGHSHGGSVSAGRVDGASQSAGRLGAAGGGLRDGNQSRRAIVGDDLGSATASLLRVQSRSRGRGNVERNGLSATVESLMTAVQSTIGDSRADKGSGREKRTLHDENDRD